MNTVLNRTTARCRDCGATHPARYEREGTDVWFVADCPRQTCRERVSDDADLFESFRAGAGALEGTCPAWAVFPHNNIVEITTACDLNCAYCFNRHLRRGPPAHRPVEYVLLRAREARAEGAYQITLSGGEPFLHPDFLRIVRAVRDLGMAVIVATNGHSLGTDSAAAARFRQAGGRVVSLKMDSLNPGLHHRLYGTDVRQAQRAAFTHCADAGLRLVGSAVVSRHTRGEMGPVLSEMLSHAPALGIASFQCLWTAPAATDDFGPGARVSKESVVRALCAANVVPGLVPRQFRPVPCCPSLRLDLHPDCGVATFVLKEAHRLSPADEVLDTDRLARRLRTTQPSRRPGAKTAILLAWHALRSARHERFGRVLRGLRGFLTGRGRASFVMVTVESLMDWRCQDEQRACRCGVILRRDCPSRPGACFGLESSLAR